MPYAKRTCPEVGCPEIIGRNQARCDEHTATYEKRRGSRQQRGYDAAHVAERKRWIQIIDSGAAVYCARGCGHRFRPGDAFDLGHTDDRHHWTGPECSKCNRRAAALKRNAQAR